MERGRGFGSPGAGALIGVTHRLEALGAGSVGGACRMLRLTGVVHSRSKKSVPLGPQHLGDPGGRGST